MRDRGETLQESGVSGIGKIPDDLHGNVPGFVELEMLSRVHLPECRTIESSRINTQ